VFKAAPWTIFDEERSKRQWINAPSTFLDNPFIDQQQYRDQLASSCPNDPELLRAWLEGDWTVARGAYFATVLEESRNAVGPFKSIPESDQYKPGDIRRGEKWLTWIAHDFGSAAPSVTYLVGESPGAKVDGVFYPRDSLVLIDELAVVRRDNLNLGLNWNAATTAEAIVEFCEKWKVRPRGVADDAIFSRTGSSAGSISDEFSRKGVYFQPAKKADRITGWQKMKRLLADAGKPDVPGLYVSRECEYFWSTVPYLARDQKRVEDVDSSGPDHGADAARYGILRRNPNASFEPLRL